MPGSIGFYGSIVDGTTTKYGFFTAAHVVLSNSTVKIDWFTSVGKTIKWQLANNGEADVAFVEMTGYGHSFSNKVEGIQLRSNVFVIPALNSTVYFVGNHAKNVPGTVEDNNMDSYIHFQITGQYYHLFSLINVSGLGCVGGDSGGLLYTKSGNTASVCGILTGGTGSSDDFTKASKIPWGAKVL